MWPLIAGGIGLGTTFAGMAVALREHVARTEMDYALLPREMRESTEIAVLRTSNGIFGEAADILARLVMHEREVRRLAAEDFLVDFPTFTSDRAQLRVGVDVLVRAHLFAIELLNPIVLMPTAGPAVRTHIDLRSLRHGWYLPRVTGSGEVEMAGLSRFHVDPDYIVAVERP